MKFCTNMSRDVYKTIELQGHRSRSHYGPFVRFFLHDTRGQYLALLVILIQLFLISADRGLNQTHQTPLIA